MRLITKNQLLFGYVKELSLFMSYNFLRKKTMIKLLSVLIFLLFNSLYCRADNSELCNIASSALNQASAIRGLKQRSKVPCYIRDKEAVKKYLLHTINTKIPKEKLSNEEFVFKALGLLPENFSYKEGIVELYLSQLGGYYDPEEDYFVMASWMPAILQTTIAVHEMTHALQDQYYDLSKLVDHKGDNSDEQFAKMALVEGDATAVMIDFTRALAGQKRLSEEDNVTSVIVNNLLGASLMFANIDVPESLKLLLLFPYNSGLRFAHHLLQDRGYKSIDKAFKRPPLTTEEILHPEKYPAGNAEYKVFKTEELAKKIGKDEKAIIYQDTVGEFGTATLLGSSGLDKRLATKAAAGWGGDMLAVFKEDNGNKSILWLSAWDTSEDSKEFFKVFKAHLAKLYKKVISDSETEFIAEGNKAKVKLKLDLSNKELSWTFQSRSSL